jgi:hypothetical protein
VRTAISRPYRPGTARPVLRTVTRRLAGQEGRAAMIDKLIVARTAGQSKL